MKVIGLLNQKGGVAKTTTASVLAYGLAERGYKVLAIDMDSQGNLTTLFKINPDDVEVSLYEVMTNKLISKKQSLRMQCLALTYFQVLPM